MTRKLAIGMACLAAAALGACAPAEKTENRSAEITVNASDTGCALSATKGSSRDYTFVINNTGTKVTEFYVYDDAQRVLAEAENISPGLQRRIDVRFDRPGTYQTACKPGMSGDGIRGDFTVS